MECVNRTPIRPNRGRGRLSPHPQIGDRRSSKIICGVVERNFNVCELEAFVPNVLILIVLSCLVTIVVMNLYVTAIVRCLNLISFKRTDDSANWLFVSAFCL